MIAEESPMNHMYFRIGTMDLTTKYGRAMVETNDILWPPFILRYGLCGILFWILYFMILYKRYKESTSDSLMAVGVLWVLFCIFQSFGTDWVKRPYLVLPMLLLAVAVNTNRNIIKQL